MLSFMENGESETLRPACTGNQSVEAHLRAETDGLFDIVNRMIRARAWRPRAASARLLFAIAIIRRPARGTQKHLENRPAGGY